MQDILGDLMGHPDLPSLPGNKAYKITGLTIPDAPCREYLPTLGEKWPHSRGNVGKYSRHGAFGNINQG